MKTPDMGPSPERPMKQWKVLIEMEGYDTDGKEVTGPALYEEVVVSAANEDEAEDLAANMDFGTRRVSYIEAKELRDLRKER